MFYAQILLFSCVIGFSDFVKSARNNDYEHVLTKLLFFHGPSIHDHSVYAHNELVQLMSHPKYDSNRSTVMFIHGFKESGKRGSAAVIANAYATRDDHNLIILDWENEASGDYFINGVPNSVTLGIAIGDVLLDAFDNGLDIDKFYIVSHSLGSQVAGVIGRHVSLESEQTKMISRICGLDPAFPGFFPSIFFKHLNNNDAKFVDIIHTDAGLYGQPISTGTADFYPNGGDTLQPGCPSRLFIPLSDNDLCSHRRSFRYFAESVRSPKGSSFQAVGARNWRDFKRHETNITNVVNMGIDCPTNASGDYFLQTNSKSPFSRGPGGISYVN